jgi:hypothetical protein
MPVPKSAQQRLWLCLRLPSKGTVLTPGLFFGIPAHANSSFTVYRHHQRGSAVHLWIGGPLYDAQRATYKSGNLFRFNGLADQKRTHSHGHCMESQRTDKSTEMGEPFRTGEDPSHHINNSDKTKHQQQDTDNP